MCFAENASRQMCKVYLLKLTIRSNETFASAAKSSFDPSADSLGLFCLEFCESCESSEQKKAFVWIKLSAWATLYWCWSIWCLHFPCESMPESAEFELAIGMCDKRWLKNDWQSRGDVGVFSCDSRSKLSLEPELKLMFRLLGNPPDDDTATSSPSGVWGNVMSSWSNMYMVSVAISVK